MTYTLVAKEAAYFGLAITVIGLIVTYVVMNNADNNKQVKFKHWNYVALTFFISGILVHFFAEYSGVNKYYCKHGNACRT